MSRQRRHYTSASVDDPTATTTQAETSEPPADTEPAEAPPEPPTAEELSSLNDSIALAVLNSGLRNNLPEKWRDRADAVVAKIAAVRAEKDKEEEEAAKKEEEEKAAKLQEEAEARIARNPEEELVGQS